MIKYTSATSVTDVNSSITETFNHQNHIEPIEISKHNNILYVSVKKTTSKKYYKYGNRKLKNINISYRQEIIELTNIVP